MPPQGPPPGAGSRGPVTEPRGIRGEAAREGEQWTLQIVAGPPSLVGTTHPIALKALSIGRAADCDVVLAPKSVSRYHARLEGL